MSQTSLFIGSIHFGAKLVEMSILELNDYTNLYWEHQPQITMASPHLETNLVLVHPGVYLPWLVVVQLVGVDPVLLQNTPT